MADYNHHMKAGKPYETNVYEGKAEQMTEVTDVVLNMGFIPQSLVIPEVGWFYSNLGIDDMYFQTNSVETIANHILALYSAKVSAFSRNAKSFEIKLNRETDESAAYILTARPGVSVVGGPQYEKRIDEKYLNNSTKSLAYRLETYCSPGPVSDNTENQLRCYFVKKCDFVKSDVPENLEEVDIKSVSDKTFLKKASQNILDIYQRLMNVVLTRTGPVIDVFDVEGSREKRLVVAYRHKTTKNFFSKLSDTYHAWDLTSSRKYVEQFSNGVTIVLICLSPAHVSRTTIPIEESIYQVMKDASLMFCHPNSLLQPLFQKRQLSLQETVYAHIGWIFAQHFLNRLGNEYTSLVRILNTDDPGHQEVLNNIKKRLRQDTFTREYILEIVMRYPELIKLLYVNFAMTHYVDPRSGELGPTLSYQRLQTSHPLTDQELHMHLKRVAKNGDEFLVLESFLVFNKHVLKTNFYQPTKVALAFRLDPAFLPEVEYPQKLFGMFMFVGAEFRGFHLRLKDVARGGVRVVKSRNREAYSINLRNCFDENYALAATQQRKNKDIPEGGSKGVILLDAEEQDKAFVAFQKYCDAMLDLLLKGESAGIKDRIIDLYKKPEIIFLGPDENTAEFMDWAAMHARYRSAPWWNSFTTGKSASTLGGIPHDVYGMTSLSIRQYILGIYKQFGLDETQVTKVQTGGPDGDLGSNEILLSKDKTIGVVDGSGVVYDPNGLDRAELVRLAKARSMVSHFDKEKLGKGGYKVMVEDVDIKLPSGEIIPDGVSFRDTFHLRVTSDIFVPCGGRPESINMNNVRKLFGADGKPHFKYIVEGANLFITQEARLFLENHRVVLFKDASANKGGVTSSSLEVLAGLALDDTEYDSLMCFQNDTATDYYRSYVEDIKNIIIANAASEFAAIEKAHIATKKSRTLLSDDLSTAIVELRAELENTDLLGDKRARYSVFTKLLPKTLIEKVGVETIIQRLPESYQRSMFAAYVASRFIYTYGLGTPGANVVNFYKFMSVI